MFRGHRRAVGQFSTLIRKKVAFLKHPIVCVYGVSSPNFKAFSNGKNEIILGHGQVGNKMKTLCINILSLQNAGIDYSIY